MLFYWCLPVANVLEAVMNLFFNIAGQLKGSFQFTLNLCCLYCHPSHYMAMPLPQTGVFFFSFLHTQSLLGVTIPLPSQVWVLQNVDVWMIVLFFRVHEPPRTVSHNLSMKEVVKVSCPPWMLLVYSMLLYTMYCTVSIIVYSDKGRESACVCSYT